MARARPNPEHTSSSPADIGVGRDADFEENSTRHSALDLPPEGLTTNLPSPPIEALFQGEGSTTHLPDPQAAPRMLGDATQKNRRAEEHAVVSARSLGGNKFRQLEQRVAKAKASLLDAPEGADLASLQADYRAAKGEHEAALKTYAAEANKKAEVRHYEVLQSTPDGKPKNATTKGSIGQARFPIGKQIDSLNFDVEALRKQGVRLREIPREEIEEKGAEPAGTTR